MRKTVLALLVLIAPPAALCQSPAQRPGPPATFVYADGRPADLQHPVHYRPASDPYGFVDWLNATRAQHGLGAVVHDPNLSAWAASNNAQQAARGLGHFVMGPARRQNAGMGPYASMPGMWMASPLHRAALLDPTISFVGIAGAGAYWTYNAY